MDINDNFTLSNIREAINGSSFKEKKFFHIASRLHFTIQEIKVDRLSAISSVDHYNPIKKEFPDPDEVIREKNILYLLFGIKEFKFDRETVENFYDNNAFTISTFDMIREIKLLNPTQEEKLCDFIIVLAFNQHELSIIRSFYEANELTTLSKFLSNNDNTIEALSICSGFLSIFSDLYHQARVSNIDLIDQFRIAAKPLLKETGWPEHIWVNLPDPPVINKNINTTIS